MELHERAFADPGSAAAWLAGDIADQLTHAVTARGWATLVVSGGRTPGPMFDLLARHDVPWAHVDVTLADERWVPPDHADSNERLVRSRLLTGPAAAARFVSLYSPTPDPESAQPAIEARLQLLPERFDVVLLGMGEDGHTASLFPGGSQLKAALDLHSGRRTAAMRAPGAPHPRMTLTRPALVGTASLYLQISGETKRELLQEALEMRGIEAPPPVVSVLDAATTKPTLVWSPDA